jgi:hypothetical protein
MRPKIAMVRSILLSKRDHQDVWATLEDLQDLWNLKHVIAVKASRNFKDTIKFSIPV